MIRTIRLAVAGLAVVLAGGCGETQPSKQAPPPPNGKGAVSGKGARPPAPPAPPPGGGKQ
jgi:hypothetical protein